MFTGIVESLGTVKEAISTGTSRTFRITSHISEDLKADQSVAHDGVCLTVEDAGPEGHRVTAVEETLKKTNLHLWQPGHTVNLERSMQIQARLDGHLVQGHVDTTAACIDKKDMDGSWYFRFAFNDDFAALIVEKGSISINGISLTAFDISSTEFSVAIIPFTFTHTNIYRVEKGTWVNLEFDIIGKYVQRHQSLYR